MSKNGTEIKAMNDSMQAKVIKTGKEGQYDCSEYWLVSHLSHLSHLLPPSPYQKFSLRSNIHGARKCLVLDKDITLSPNNYNINLALASKHASATHIIYDHNFLMTLKFSISSKHSRGYMSKYVWTPYWHQYHPYWWQENQA